MYVMACAVIMWSTLGQVLRRLVTQDSRKMAGGLAYIVAALMASAPLLSTLYEGLLMAGGNPVSMSSGRPTVWLSLAGSCLFGGLLVFQVVSVIREKASLSFWKTGGFLICGLAVLETGVAAFKQVTFADDRAGMISFDFFRDEVTDIKCDGGILLARFEKRDAGSSVAYRCPTVMILNRNSTTPFLPWPDYTEGSSAALGKAIDDMKEQAKQVD